MAKKKQRKYIPHAVMEIDAARKLEIMFNSNLDKVTVRAVVNGEPQKPYVKSDLFLSEEHGPYFVIAGGEDEAGEITYVTMYLSNFKNVRKA